MVHSTLLGDAGEDVAVIALRAGRAERLGSGAGPSGAAGREWLVGG